MASGLIFLSYSRKDVDLARELASKLKAAGANVWLDVLELQPGTHWDDHIEEALGKAETVLVLLSNTSRNSHHVKDEYSYALEEGKRVVPVRLEECKAPLRLRRLQFVDYVRNKEEGIRTLKKALGLKAISFKKDSKAFDYNYWNNPLFSSLNPIGSGLFPDKPVKRFSPEKSQYFNDYDFSPYSKRFKSGCLVIQQNPGLAKPFTKAIGTKIYKEGYKFFIEKEGNDHYFNYGFYETAYLSPLLGNPLLNQLSTPTSRFSLGNKEPKPMRQKINLNSIFLQPLTKPDFLSGWSFWSYNHHLLLIQTIEPFVFAVGPAEGRLGAKETKK